MLSCYCSRSTPAPEPFKLAFVGIVSFVLAGCGERSQPAAGPSAHPSAPTLAEPPSAPPFEPVLAEPSRAEVAAPRLETQVARLKTLAAELAPELSQIPTIGTASPGSSPLEPARHTRWELRFPPGSTIENYTRQLDVLQIELGLIGGNQEITYLSNLSNPKPQSRTAAAADDSRVYLVWQRGEMRTADVEIAKRAGVPTEGRVLALFLPREVEDELARVEESYAKQIGVAHIARTVFGIRSAGADSFRFFVIEQQPAVR
jgi:hypothetical protein